MSEMTAAGRNESIYKLAEILEKVEGRI